MKLENSVLDMMKLEIDPDLIKYNEMKYTIVKVIKDLCSNKNSKMKKNTRQVKETNVEREDRGRNEIYAG